MATFEFKLPDVGEGLHEAEITKWLVKVGDMVREDQPVVEVQTDKVTTELTSPVKGRVLSLHGQEGEVVHVGSVIITFETEGAAPAAPSPAPVSPAAPAAPAHAAGGQSAAVPSAPAAAPAAPAPAAVPAAAPAPVAPAQAAVAVAARPEGGRVLATPATRRVARELGVDIQLVPGTGPAGRVTTEDVQRFAAALKNGAAPAAAAPAADAPAAGTPAPAAPPPPAAVPGERIPLKGIRRTIAQRMVAAKHTAPHVTVVDEYDATALVALRERAKAIGARENIKVTYLPFIVKALVAALKEFPYLNASIDEAKQEIVLHTEYNIGIAVDTAGGLVVPVVKNADRKTILQIAAEIQSLSEKAHAGKLSLDEITGGTCSISNMGAVGAGLFFTPVINVPEVAILGVGKLADRPVVRDGQIVVRKMQYLSLSFDHRLVDGAPATRFLARVMELLSDPTLLLMEMM